MLLFPNGQPPTPRWRWVSVAAIVWAALFVLLTVLLQQINSATTPNLVFDNPIGVLGQDTVERLRLIGVWIVGLLALVVVCAVALFVRYRRANATEREQIKWLLYACALFLVVYVGDFVGGLGGKASVGGYIWGVFFGLSVIALPAAIGIAILRYRLYDIDVVINRTLVYGSLTVSLALVYFGGVTATQAIFRNLTGQQELPQLVVVASTLVIAALFNPLRRRIQYVHRPQLLQEEVRCGEDPRSLLRQAEGRDGPRCAERRPGGSGKGDDAARPRLGVAAPFRGRGLE